MNHNPINQPAANQPTAKGKPTDAAQLANLNQIVQSHPVAVVASALSRLNNRELAELGNTITPRIAQLYEKSFGPAILHVLAPITAAATGHADSHADGAQKETAQPAASDDQDAGGDSTADEKGDKGDKDDKDDKGDETDADGAGATQTTLSPQEVADLEIEIRTLMRDPRYWRDHDPAQLAKVAQAFEKLYG